MNFSLRLKELREEKGFSQAQLARVLNVGVGSVGMWESTDRIPPAKKLSKIADYFQVTTDYLLGREGDWNRNVSNTPLSEYTAEERNLIEAYRDLRPDMQSLLLDTIKIWQEQNASSEASKKKA